MLGPLLFLLTICRSDINLFADEFILFNTGKHGQEVQTN